MALADIAAWRVSPALDALTDRQRAGLVEVVFCSAWVASATAISTTRRCSLRSPATSRTRSPRPKTRRYGVDLESLAAGRPGSTPTTSRDGPPSASLIRLRARSRSGSDTAGTRRTATAC